MILVGGPVSYGRDQRYKPTKPKRPFECGGGGVIDFWAMPKKGGKINVFHCLTQMKVIAMAFTGKCKLDKCAYEEMCAN